MNINTRSVDKGTILVTGGAGYIGSHTCKALQAGGYTSIVYDNLRYGHAHAAKWSPVVEGELADMDLLKRAIERYRPDAIVHFAAYLFVDESVQDPSKYYHNNIAGTLALLETMREIGVDTIVFSSTAAVYGVPQQVPIKETTPMHPINPYGRTKLAIEWALEDYSAAYGMKYAALRYFNACGADRGNQIGEEHKPETHLIPRALMALGGELDEFCVFGADYDTPDGTCIRDYIHVDDLAQGHILALEHLARGGESGAFNLGSGDGYSVKQILSAVERVTGKRLPLTYGERRAGDPPILTADVSKAYEVLGFKTKYSDLETIIRTAWAFYQKRASRPN